MKKLIPLILLTSTACSTTEIAHVPLDCREITQSQVHFTDQENQTTPLTVKKKFKKRSDQLKEMITLACNDILDHNESFNK